VLGSSVGGVLARPDAGALEQDYRWLSQVYVSVQPTSGTGGLLWHALGAKTIELIHQNVHVYAVRDDLDDPHRSTPICWRRDGHDPIRTPKREIEFKLAQRLRRHMGNPRYKRSPNAWRR
jgi:type I restriction enzyme R subunit